MYRQLQSQALPLPQRKSRARLMPNAAAKSASRMRTRTNSISMRRTRLKSLARVEQVYTSPLRPHHQLPGRVRGEKERHGGTIAHSEFRRAVPTGGNLNLRKSVNDDRRTDNTALTLMCVKLLESLDGTGEEGGPVELIAPVRVLVVTDSDEVSVVIVTKEVY
jgi:hypothetical protein